jgi:hypothetical protein
MKRTCSSFSSEPLPFLLWRRDLLCTGLLCNVMVNAMCLTVKELKFHPVPTGFHMSDIGALPEELLVSNELTRLRDNFYFCAGSTPIAQ